MSMPNHLRVLHLVLALFLVPTLARAQSEESLRVSRLVHNRHGNAAQSGPSAREELAKLASEPELHIPHLLSYLSLDLLNQAEADLEIMRSAASAATLLLQVCGPDGADALEPLLMELHHERLLREASYRAQVQSMAEKADPDKRQAALAIRQATERLSAVESAIIRLYGAAGDPRLVHWLTPDALRRDSTSLAVLEYLELVAPYDPEVTEALYQVYMAEPEGSALTRRLAARIKQHATQLAAADESTYALACVEKPSASGSGPSISCSDSTGGGAIEVVRDAVGSYLVSFDGISGVGGNVQVSAHGKEARRCTVGGWYGAKRLNVRVHCFDAAGKPQDSGFGLFYQREGKASSKADGSLAYVWAGGAERLKYEPPVEFGRAGAKPSTVKRSSPGRYRVRLPSFSAAESHLRVTPYGVDPVTCTTAALAQDGDAVLAEVVCRDLKGEPADSLFTLEAAAGRMAGTSTKKKPLPGMHLRAVPKGSSVSLHAWFSSDGLAYKPQLARVGKGHYELELAGPLADKAAELVLAGALGDESGSCQVASQAFTKEAVKLVVLCHDLLGAPADRAFWLDLVAPP